MAETLLRKTIARRPKRRRFYVMNYAYHALADFEIENLGVLNASLNAEPGMPLRPPPGRRGFPVYAEKPRFVFGRRKKGPRPKDLELYHDYWLISDRLKSLFESVDQQAFAFQPCDVFLRDGSPGPTYWLCDVVRTLEAFDRDTLEKIERRKGSLQYVSFLSWRDSVDYKPDKIDFNEAVIGDAHMFRTPYSYHDKFCDQRMKDACKEAGIKGVQFFADWKY